MKSFMYKPTVEDTQALYKHLNKEMFNNVLPPVRIKIKKNLKIKHKGKKCDVWAYQHKDKIVLTHKFPCYNLFEEILAHEMVHVWQACMTGDMHGKSFKLWDYAFSQRGLRLKKTYNEDDYT